MAPTQHLALGLLLLAACAASAVSAKHPLLSDRLTGPARAASAQPASYDDATHRATFTEIEACGVWGKKELNEHVTYSYQGTNPYSRYGAGWTSTLACSNSHPSSSYYQPEDPLFNPIGSPAGWCYFAVESYDNVPVPGGTHGDLVVDGSFVATCYFGEGGKDSCLPEECGETELLVSAPFYQSDTLLFSVDPESATLPARCAQDNARRREMAANNKKGADAAKEVPAKRAPQAASVATADASASFAATPGPSTPTTYYEGRGNIYAGAGTLYSRRGPFKSEAKSAWFQYVAPNFSGSGFTSITNPGGRTVYTPWTYTIDFPTVGGGKDEYPHYRE